MAARSAVLRPARTGSSCVSLGVLEQRILDGGRTTSDRGQTGGLTPLICVRQRAGVADFAGWRAAGRASRRRAPLLRGIGRGSRRSRAWRRWERVRLSIPRHEAAHRPPEKPAIHGGGGGAPRGRRVQAVRRFPGRRFHPPPPRSAIDLGAAGRRVVAPARRSAGTTRPMLSRGSRRGRSRLPQSLAANARRAAVPSATRPSRRGGDGGTRRHRRRCGRHRAPRLRSRPVPRARKRSAQRAGTRLRRSARSAFCRRAQGPACSSRPGCIRGPSPATAAR